VQGELLVKKSRANQLIVAVALLLAAYGIVRVGPAAFRYGQPAVALTGDHMQMLQATAADSFVPEADPLKTSGWTVAASDQESSNPASYAIDGNPATFWHSEYSPTQVALPHSITINMHALHWCPG